MIEKHRLRYGKQGPGVGYSKMKLVDALNYETIAKERFELMRKRPKPEII